MHTAVPEHTVRHQEHVDILRRDVVVEGVVGGELGLAVAREFLRHRVTLGPTTVRVLALEDEAERSLDCRLVFRVAPLDVEPEQEACRFGRAAVVEGRVAVLVLELLEAPGVFPDGRVPAAERCLAREVDHVVPPAAFVLPGDERIGGLGSGLVVGVVAGRAMRVEKNLPHRGRSGALHPDHRVVRFELTPASRKVGKVRPHVAAAMARAFHHECRRPLHGGERERAGRRGFGRARRGRLARRNAIRG